LSIGEVNGHFYLKIKVKKVKQKKRKKNEKKQAELLRPADFPPAEKYKIILRAYFYFTG